MIEPILIYPALYVLKLTDDCYYIGMTMNLNIRLAQHMIGKGAKFTRLHKPIELIKVIYPAIDNDIENNITREYIDKYGSDKVKGGSYCRC